MTHQLQVAYLGSGNLFGRIVTTFLRQFPSVLRLNIYGSTESILSEDLGGHCKVQQFVGKEQLPAALEGIDIVVIGDESNTVEPSRERVHYIASKVFDYAYFTGLISPKAMVVVSASPLNLMLPLMGHVLQDLGCFDGRKLLGVTSEETLRANPLLAEFTGVDEAILPVVGGASPQTRVPLFSQAKPQVELKEADKHKLIEDIKSFDLSYPREEIVAERAYATIRLLRALIQGLENSKNPITQMAMTKTSLVPDTTYFSLPVELGQYGVQRAFGLPVLQGIEEELLEYAVVNLNHDYTRAYDIFKGLKHNLEDSSNDNIIFRKKHVCNKNYKQAGENSFTYKEEACGEKKGNSSEVVEDLTNCLTSLQELEKLGYEDSNNSKMLSSKWYMSDNVVNLNFINTDKKHCDNLKTVNQLTTEYETNFNKNLKNIEVPLSNNKHKSTISVKIDKFKENVISDFESSFGKESFKNFKPNKQTIINSMHKKSECLNKGENLNSGFFESNGIENADIFVINSLGKSIEETLNIEYCVHQNIKDRKSASNEGKYVLNNEVIIENEKSNSNELKSNEIKNTSKQIMKCERNIFQKNMNESNNGYSQVINHQNKTENIKGHFNLDHPQKNRETETFLSKNKNASDELIKCHILYKENEGPKKMLPIDKIPACIFENISPGSNSEKNDSCLKYRPINTNSELKRQHLNNETSEPNPKNTEQDVTIVESELAIQKELTERETVNVPFTTTRSLNEVVHEETTYISDNSTKCKAESSTKLQDHNLKLSETNKTKIINRNASNKKQNCNNQNNLTINVGSSSHDATNPPTVNYIIKSLYQDVNKVVSEREENVQNIFCLTKEKSVNQNKIDFEGINSEETAIKTCPKDHQREEACGNVYTNKEMKTSTWAKEFLVNNNNMLTPEKHLPIIAKQTKTNYTMNKPNVKSVKTSEYIQQRNLLKDRHLLGHKYNNEKGHNLDKINDRQQGQIKKFEKTFKQINRKQIKTTDLNTASFKSSPVMSNIDKNNEMWNNGIFSRQMCSEIKNSVQVVDIKKNNKNVLENGKKRNFQEITTLDNEFSLKKSVKLENTMNDNNLHKIKNVKTDDSHYNDLSLQEKSLVELENSNVQSISEKESPKLAICPRKNFPQTDPQYRDEMEQEQFDYFNHTIKGVNKKDQDMFSEKRLNIHVSPFKEEIKSYKRETQKLIGNEERGFPGESVIYENQSEKFSCLSKSENKKVTFSKNECIENSEIEGKIAIKNSNEDYELLKYTAGGKSSSNENNLQLIRQKLNKKQNSSLIKKFNILGESQINKLNEINIPRTTKKLKLNDQKTDQLKPQGKTSSYKIESCRTFKTIINGDENEKMEQAKRKLKLANKYNAPLKNSFNKERAKRINIQLNWRNKLNTNQKENILQSQDQTAKMFENKIVAGSELTKSEETNENFKSQNIDYEKDKKTYSFSKAENIGSTTEKNLDKQTETEGMTVEENEKNISKDLFECSGNVIPMENDLMNNIGENFVLKKQNKIRICNENTEELKEKNSQENSIKKDFHNNMEIEKNKTVVEDNENRDTMIHILTKERNLDKTENSMKKLLGQNKARTENIKCEQINEIESCNKCLNQEMEVKANLTNSLTNDQKSKKGFKENINYISISPLSDLNFHENNQSFFSKESSKNAYDISKFNNIKSKSFMKQQSILKKEDTNMLKENQARNYEPKAKENIKNIEYCVKYDSPTNFGKLHYNESPFSTKIESTIKLRKGPSTIIFDRISKKSQSSKTAEKLFGIRRSHNLSLVSPNQGNYHETKNLVKYVGDRKNEVNIKKNVDFVKIDKKKLNFTKIKNENKIENSKQCSIKKHFRDNSPPKINSIKTFSQEQLINKTNTEILKHSIKKMASLGTKIMFAHPSANKKTETWMNTSSNYTLISNNSNSNTNKNDINLAHKKIEKDRNSKSLYNKSTSKKQDQNRRDKINGKKALEMGKEYNNIRSPKHNEGSTSLNESEKTREINETMKLKKIKIKSSPKFECEEIIPKRKKESMITIMKPKFLVDSNKIKKKCEDDDSRKDNINFYKKTEKNCNTEEIKTHEVTADMKSRDFLKTELSPEDIIPPQVEETNPKYFKSNLACISSTMEGPNNNIYNFKSNSQNSTESCIKKFKPNNALVSINRDNLQEIPNRPGAEKGSSISISKEIKIKPNYLRWSSKSLKTKQNIGMTRILGFSKNPNQKHITNKNSSQKLLTDNNIEKLKITANIFKDYMYKNRNIKGNNQQKHLNNSSVKEFSIVSQDMCDNNVNGNSENNRNKLSIATISSAEEKCVLKKFKNKNILGHINSKMYNSNTVNIKHSDNTIIHPEAKKISGIPPKMQTMSRKLKKKLTHHIKTENSKCKHPKDKEPLISFVGENVREKIPHYTPSARNFLDLSPVKIITPLAREKEKQRKIHLLKAHQNDTSKFKSPKKSDIINIKYKSEADLLENNKHFFTMHNPIALLRKEGGRILKPMTKLNQLIKFKSEERLPSSRVEKHLPHSSPLAVIKQNDSCISGSRASTERGNLKKQLSKLFYMFQSVIKKQ